MLVAAALFVAANVSPVGIDVVTNDGRHRVLSHADADSTVVEVCARHKDGKGAAVCGAVVDDRFGQRVSLDIADSGDLVFSTVFTRFDGRAAAPAAIAGGLAVVSVISGCVALGLAQYASATTDVGVAAAAPAVAVPGADAAGALAVAVAGGAVVAGAAALVVGYAAWNEATERHTE